MPGVGHFGLEVKLNAFGRLNLDDELVGVEVRPRAVAKHHDRRLRGTG